MFGSANTNAEIDFVNPIDLGGSDRTIQVTSGLGGDVSLHDRSPAAERLARIGGKGLDLLYADHEVAVVAQPLENGPADALAATGHDDAPCHELTSQNSIARTNEKD